MGKKTKLEPLRVVFMRGDVVVEEFEASKKKFKSGSRGYYAFGRLNDFDFSEYRVSCNIVELGTKPDSDDSDDEFSFVSIGGKL